MPDAGDRVELDEPYAAESAALPLCRSSVSKVKRELDPVLSWLKSVTPRLDISDGELLELFWEAHPRFQFFSSLNWGTNLVDLGAGNGGLAHWKHWVKPARPDLQLYGVDFSAGEYSNLYADWEAIDLDLAVPRFPGVELNGFYASHLIEHLAAPERLVEWIGKRAQSGARVYLEWPSPTTIALPRREELLNHGVDVVISNFADDLTHRQTLELPVVSRWLSDAGLTVVASGAVDLGILGEELFARATDSELRSMGYWSMVQFSLYAVAIKGEEPPSSFSLRAARRAAHDRLGAEHAPGEVTPPLRPTGEEIAYGESAYAARVSAQLDQYRETAYIHELPPAFHYWSESYLGPRIQRVFGATQAHEIIAAAWASDPPSKEGSYSFASLGAGDCSIEIAVARQLIARGLQNFRIDAFELSAGLQERAREAARQYEVEERFRFIECDLNNHDIVEHYDGVMAHHSLHHFVKLERIFDNVKQVLRPEANFVVWDMIGRNGHMRWPETLSLIEHLWPILPEAKKFNHMLHETWPKFVNFDCSQEGFEGVRAQDILPLLLERFYPSHFVAAGGIIEVFIDRSFGPNFNPSDDWDRQFIDLVEHLNSRLIECGAIKPTMMYAVFRNECCECRCEGDLTPKFCVRAPI